MRIAARLIVTLTLVVGSFTAAAQSVAEVFDSTVLQDVQLWVNSRDLAQLRQHFDLNTNYPSDWIWRSQRVRNAAIRSRGFGSRNGTKLGLLVDFGRYTSAQRFAGRQSLVLDNLWQDPSMIREIVAMSLFARVGVVSPVEAPGRLFINSEYQGVYGLVESIDADFLARNGLDPSGYLYEYHHNGPYYFQDLGDDLSAYARLFEPRTRQTEAPVTLYQPLRDMMAAIAEPSDTLWRERVEAYVDLEQLLTNTAVASFLSELDGLLGYEGINNFYLYRPANSTRHQFIPWDRDNSFQGVEDSVFRRADQNALIGRALTYPDLYDLYLNVLERTALLATQDDFLANQIEAVAAVIETAAAADVHAPYTQDERAAALTHLRDFARRRPGIVLQQVAAARAATQR